jgi:ferrous iron transport protein B
MAHCHPDGSPTPQPDPSTSAAPSLRVCALAGNPNCGKTTLFNALTGLRQKVANYPGVTVEKKTGICRLDDGSKLNIIDLPGTYSLISRSPDEVVAMEVLRGLRKDTPPPDAVIVVVDASNLQRNLYLVSQLIEVGRPMVIALNMMDIAKRRGINVSAERLEKILGVPVVEVVGHKKQGITPLKEAIGRACVAKMPEWPLPEAMKEEVALLGESLSKSRSREPSGSAAGLPVEDLGKRSTFNVQRSTSNEGANTSDLNVERWKLNVERLPSSATVEILRNRATAERLLIGDSATDLAALSKQEPIATHLADAQARLKQLGIDPMQADIEAHYQWIDEVAAGALTPACELIGDLPRYATLAPVVSPSSKEPVPILPYSPKANLSQRVDAILIHRVWGLVIFAGIMAVLFVSIFWLAKPIMDAMGDCMNWLGNWVTHKMGPGPLHDLIAQGIFPGVGTVLTFLPQIALLFFFLAILEDSGYLARAAFLMDRLLAKVGLHGKSFIPLLSSFACAIPGIMATRTIENRKDRLATILVAPFMSCSARLPVYSLLIGTCFVVPGVKGSLLKGGIMLSCYLLGILAAVVTALIFKRSFLKGMPSSFILELPTYKLPQASIVARQVWSNSKQFVVKAGTTIFAMSVVLWALAYYPRLPKAKAEAVKSSIKVLQSDFTSVHYEKNDLNQFGVGFGMAGLDVIHRENGKTLGFEQLTGRLVSGDLSASEQEQLTPILEKRMEDAIAAAQSEYSFAGRFGHVLEPVIHPLGFNWKMGVGLVGAFAARETFVSTEGIIYATGGDTDAGTDSLQKAMTAERYASGKPVWTPLVAVSLLIWFVLAMQCMSTVAIIKRETGGWAWPIFTIVYMNGLAYVLCLLVFQIGSHLGY